MSIDFKEEIKADAYVVTPIEKVYEQVKSVEKVNVVGKAAFDDKKGGSGEQFAELLSQESHKLEEKNKEVKNAYDELDVDERKIQEGKLNYYTMGGRNAVFYMTISTTDLKG